MPAWNRTDRTGLAANIIGMLALTALTNGAIYALGWNAEEPGAPVIPHLPPGWAIGAVWTVLLTLQAILRWHLLRDGARRAADWVGVNMLIAIGYPFYTAGLDFAPGVVFNGITFGIALGVSMRVAEHDPRRALWLAPTLAWFLFVNAVSGLALAQLPPQ